MMLSNIQMDFEFLYKDMMRKIITTIRPKLEYAKIIRSLDKKKHLLKLERIQNIGTKMMLDLEDHTNECGSGPKNYN